MPGLPSDQHGTLHSKESGTSFCPRNEASDQENLRRCKDDALDNVARSSTTRRCSATGANQRFHQIQPQNKMWNSHSRYGKSDRFGQRRFHKFLEVSSSIARQMERMKPTPYRHVAEDHQRNPSTLSLHSIRRGAIMALAENFEAEKIIRLTGHTPLVEPEARLREYIFSEPTHRLARDQRQMSKYLCMLLEGREIAKVTFTSQ